MCGDPQLRRELEQITESTLRSEDKANRILGLRDKDAHTIELTSEPKSPYYTCFRHALDLVTLSKTTEERYEGVTDEKAIRGIFTRLYMQLPLIPEADIPSLSSKDAIIICYVDSQGILRHAGKCDHDGFVISKWGKGNVWKHGMFEVPANYGDNICLYRSLGAKRHDELFLELLNQYWGFK